MNCLDEFYNIVDLLPSESYFDERYALNPSHPSRNDPKGKVYCKEELYEQIGILYLECLQSDFYSEIDKYSKDLLFKYHPSIWKCTVRDQMSPYDGFYDNKKLIRGILNLSKYMPHFLFREDRIYKLIMQMSIAKIIQRITLFRPAEATRILKTYASYSKNVLNPMQGYSAWLLACHKLYKNYIGYDINPTTIVESNNIIESLGVFNARVAVKNLLDTEECVEYKDTTLVCCPPYNLTEQWGQEISNKSSSDWCREILKRYKCNKYIFITNRNDGFGKYTVESKSNGSQGKHINTSNVQYVIVIK